MKAPRRPEEHFVWPPMAAVAALIVTPTLVGTFKAINSAIPAIEGASPAAVYLFSLGMGAGLSVGLHGRYWLGFGWLALLAYLLVQATRLIPEIPFQQYSLVFLASLAMMFAALSSVLYGKRLTIHAYQKTKRDGHNEP